MERKPKQKAVVLEFFSFLFLFFFWIGIKFSAYIYLRNRVRSTLKTSIYNIYDLHCLYFSAQFMEKLRGRLLGHFVTLIKTSMHRTEYIIAGPIFPVLVPNTGWRSRLSFESPLQKHKMAISWEFWFAIAKEALDCHNSGGSLLTTRGSELPWPVNPIVWS